ncbi:hypothetical protein ACFWY6_11750 [Streptomyces sp. NPDC059037]|uniref:hypothetical protein n=1 Tax=Streptomyces sp. NPDC059037 TaxID=3346710 RepID=UPI0036ABBD61
MLSRVRTRWCPLLAVLLVVLGGFCAPAVAAQPVAKVTKPAAAVQAKESAGAPGCGKSGQQDAGQGPAAPARSSSAYELLPALHQAHAASGAWGADQPVLSLTPDRGPPPLAPPTPIDLSVLRV